MNDLKPQFDTYFISNETDFNRLISYEQRTPDKDFLVIDTETNSKEDKLALLWGFSICVNSKKAFYIPWRDVQGNKWWNSTIEANIINWLGKVIKTRKVIGFNIIYDTLVIENNLGLVLDDYIYSDPILQRHTLNENPPFALKEVAVNVLGNWANKAQEALYKNIEKNGGKTNKDSIEMFKADSNILGEYCNWDVILTMMLFNVFEQRLVKDGLYDFFYNQEVMPLYKLVVIPMKRKGFPINVEYFKVLKKEVEAEITKLEDDMMLEANDDILDIVTDHLNDEFPVTNKGNFPKAAAGHLEIPLPINKKTGKITLSAKAIELQAKNSSRYRSFYEWLKGGPCPLSNKTKRTIQEQMYFNKYPEERYIFNLRSNDDLIKLVVSNWGYIPRGKTEGGKYKLDDEFIESLKDKSFFDKLRDFKKLNKLLSTYIDGFLDREIQGVIYTSYLMFGTTSGRFSSRNPNIQVLPRTKEEDSGLSPIVLKYVNSIKKGFIAPPGYKLVNADYEQLEVTCFADMSGEESLKEAIIKGEDIYSKVAISVNKLNKYSANKKAPNYLKKHMPEMRQLWKVPTLGIVYGMKETRLQESIDCSYTEARDIINGYFHTYPKLKSYMADCQYQAKHLGQVKTKFGRIRHLQEAKSIYTLYGDEVLDYKYAVKHNYLDQRYKYNTLLNNSCNFPIQGLAANIVNRALVAIARKIKELGIDGYICSQCHDEITCIIKDEDVERFRPVMQDCMENTTTISVPLRAVPVVAANWAEAK